MSKGLGRSVVALFVVALALGGAALFAVNTQVGKLQAQQQAACGFAHDLGSVPIASSPKPSRLGVSLVTDSRAQWRALHCPGTLPVPPGLARWAAYYHLPGN